MLHIHTSGLAPENKSSVSNGKSVMMEMDKKKPEPEVKFVFVCKICVYTTANLQEFIQHKKSHSKALDALIPVQEISDVKSISLTQQKQDECVALPPPLLPTVEPPYSVPIDTLHVSPSPNNVPTVHLEIQNHKPEEIQLQASASAQPPHEFSITAKAEIKFNFPFQLTESPIWTSTISSQPVVTGPGSHIENDKTDDKELDNATKWNMVEESSVSPPVAQPHSHPKQDIFKRIKECYVVLPLVNTQETGAPAQTNTIPNTQRKRQPFVKCSICNELCRSSMMATHRCRDHPELKPYKCNLCPFECSTRIVYWKHCTGHKKNFKFSCFDCLDNFETAAGLNKHFHAVHFAQYNISPPLKRRRKAVASRNISTTKSLSSTTKNAVHFAQCNISPPLKPKKKAAGSRNITIRKALSPTTNSSGNNPVLYPHSGPFKCRFCPKVWLKSYECKRHEDGHLRPYQCHLCPQRFGFRGNFSLHKVNAHGLSMEEARATTVKSYSTNSLDYGVQRGSSQIPFPSVLQRDKDNISPLKKPRRKEVNSRRMSRTKSLSPTKLLSSPTILPSSSTSSHFKCRFCHKILSCRSLLEKHENQHTRPFQCQLCPYRSAAKSDLKRHKYRRHTLREENTESTTSKSTSTTPNSHYDNTKDVNADVYQRAVSSVYSRKNIFKCTKCPKSFFTSSSLRLHFTSHRVLPHPNPVQCRKCQKTFRFPSWARRHEALCTSEFPVEREHNRNVVSKLRKSGGVTKTGLEEGRSKSRQPPQTVDDPKPPRSRCTKQARIEHSHGDSHSTHPGNPLADIRTLYPTKKEERRVVKCSICKAQLPNQQTLTLHQIRCHKIKVTPIKTRTVLVVQEDKFRCKDCPFVTHRSINLRRHRKCHERMDKYKCDLCTATFSSLQARSRHFSQVHGTSALKTKRYRKGVYNYKCEWCVAMFSAKQMLAAHRILCPKKPKDKTRNITSVNFLNDFKKKFECTICKEKFIEIQDLQDHAEMECSPDDPISRRMSTSHKDGEKRSAATVTQQNADGLRITSIRFN